MTYGKLVNSGLLILPCLPPSSSSKARLHAYTYHPSTLKYNLSKEHCNLNTMGTANEIGLTPPCNQLNYLQASIIVVHQV